MKKRLRNRSICFNMTHQFKHPFTLVLTGATGSGKTEWTRRFIKWRKEIIDPPVVNVLYCYGELNKCILEIQQSDTDVELYSGVPTEELIRQRAGDAKNQQLLLILDDLMLNIRTQFLDLLFTRGSHNWSVSVVFITQHLFTREMRTARNNAHYIVLMRNPSGALQVRNLASQLFPRASNFFMEAFGDATRERFTYLLIDMHPSTAEEMRVRTHIYPDDAHCIAYVPK